jgi:GNAT superfamily N-acetyltransferase
VNRWVRYTIGLQHTPAPAPDVELMPVTDEIVASLREHPDAGAAQLRSGLRFWDHGLRRAFIWRTDGAPACIQWLLFKQDIGLLHSLREWGGMYAPLPDGWGQVENLFAFSTARRKGVATQFEYALYARARELGLTALVTHIHEDNVAARGWADRTGWREYGVITRYHIDVPGLRGLNACVHTNGGARGPGAARPMPVGAPST